MCIRWSIRETADAIRQKITSGFVHAEFYTPEHGRFVSQEFTAGDDCQMERGEAVLAQPGGGPRARGVPACSKWSSRLMMSLLPWWDVLVDKAMPPAWSPETTQRSTTRHPASPPTSDGGLDEQVRQGFEEMAVEHTERQIDELIQEHWKQADEDE